jgi:hypothetical protein
MGDVSFDKWMCSGVTCTAFVCVNGISWDRVLIQWHVTTGGTLTQTFSFFEKQTQTQLQTQTQTHKVQSTKHKPKSLTFSRRRSFVVEISRGTRCGSACAALTALNVFNDPSPTGCISGRGGNSGRRRQEVKEVNEGGEFTTVVAIGGRGGNNGR